MAESTKTILEASDIDKLSFDEIKVVADEWNVSKAGGKKATAKRIIEAQTAAPGPQDADPLPDESLDSIVLDDGLSEPERTEDRVEEYERVSPEGEIVRVRHNIDTGETEIAG